MPDQFQICQQTTRVKYPFGKGKGRKRMRRLARRRFAQFPETKLPVTDEQNGD